MAEPFGVKEAKRYDLVRIARDHGAALHLASRRLSRTSNEWSPGRRRLPYDLSVVAPEQGQAVSLPGSVTIRGVAYTGRFEACSENSTSGASAAWCGFPTAASWPLPLYELALMTAAHAADRGLPQASAIAGDPELRPLELFAQPASSAVADLLAERGIDFHGGRHAAEVQPGS